jgi:dTDP-D-glucose 4,6-dehydratase
MNNPFDITKNAAVRLTLIYNRTYGTNFSVVRGLNAYGDRQKETPARKIMPNFVIPAINKSEIVIYGTGAQKMDMIHVRNSTTSLSRR